jgi:hypothetical protein
LSSVAASRPLRLALVSLMALLLSAAAGCEAMRVKIRENERRAAVRNVRSWHDHRDWAECVASAERAQATPDLDPMVASETTLLKANCLYRLDRKVEALAHYHFLQDFLQTGDKQLALPSNIQKRLMKSPDLEAVKASPYNESLLSVSLPGARFTRAAAWSRISGQALLQWTVAKGGVSRNIRVLNDVHPLLAGLAIEAAASTEVDKDNLDRGRLPLTKRTLFTFGKR